MVRINISQPGTDIVQEKFYIFIFYKGWSNFGLNKPKHVVGERRNKDLSGNKM